MITLTVYAVLAVVGLVATGDTHPESASHLSFSEYLLGIALAIFVFLLKEQITHRIAGLRFRKRIAEDITLMIVNYAAHRPSIIHLHDVLDSDIQRMEKGQSVTPEVHPIWTSEFSLMDDIYLNSPHLAPDVFLKVVDFYDVGGRLDPVMNAYNSVVQQCVVGGAYNLSSLRFLDSCLRFMIKEYVRLVDNGRDALVSLSTRYRFLNIDVSHGEESTKELSA